MTPRFSLRLFLVLTAVAVVLAVLPGSAAHAAECPPAGGGTVPSAPAPDGDFVITAKGWGHGVGMSQYGAQGAALLGCSTTQILTTYYRGATVGTAATRRPGGPLRVGLTLGSMASNTAQALDLQPTVGAARWRLCASACSTVAVQPNAATWQLRSSAEGVYALYDGPIQIWRGGSASTVLRVRLTTAKAAREVRIPAKQRLNAMSGRYRRGSLEFASVVSATPRFHVTAVLPSVDRYLRGLAEMPSSWHPAALGAQAIVGRSYAVNRRDAQSRGAVCRCDLYDSPIDQVYVGYGKEAEGADAFYGRRWVAAVDATAGQVLHADGRLAVGYYSSSHGGHSESGAFTWGTETSYLQAVDDSRWEMASSNPLRSTAVGLSAQTLGRIFGVGTATSVKLPAPQGAAGRVGRLEAGYGGVIVSGTTSSVKVSGSVFRSKVNAYLGREAVRSTLFTVTANG